MDSSQSTYRIDKLSDDNFHAWKTRIQFVLALKDSARYLEEEVPLSTDPTHSSWLQGDIKARAIIALTLSDTHLDQAQHAPTAKKMWSLICDIYEKHTLLNKLSARRRFYTATMLETESILQYSGRIRQLASTLKSMSVTIGDAEMAMAFLNGLPDRFDPLISALDTHDSDSSTFTLDFVQSKCLQGEQRHKHRSAAALAHAEAALLASKSSTDPSQQTCVHCGKHKDSSKCYRKYPHLMPLNHPLRRKKALMADAQSSQDGPSDDTVFCLLASMPPQMALTASTSRSSASNWIVDSGCTSHLTFNRESFSTYEQIDPISLQLGGGTCLQIVGKGTMVVSVSHESTFLSCQLDDVYHAPSLRFNLLSVSSMASKGFRTIFDDKVATIEHKNTGRIIASAPLSRGLYTLVTHPPSSSKEYALAASIDIWHQRFAHVSHAGLRSMSNKQVVHGLKIAPGDSSRKCTGCVLGKSHRAPIPKLSTSRATRLLELVHSDVLGPIEVPSLGGARYVITFIDDYSKWISHYCMKAKSEALSKFQLFKAYAEKHTHQRLHHLNILQFCESARPNLPAESIELLRSDNGGEYLSNAFKDFLSSNGIHHQLTVAYTPQQNGVSERMNRTLLDLVRSMLHHRNLSKHFWAEAFATAVYVRNRVTTRSLPPHLTPHHLWLGEAPKVHHMRVFGCPCWYTVPKQKVRKLDPRARLALMMGYSSQSKGYKLWDMPAEQFVVSRDVVFNETVHPPTISASSEASSSRSVSFADLPTPTAPDSQATTQETSVPATPPQQPISTSDTTPSSPVPTILPSSPNPPNAPRRSARVSRPPKPWWLSEGSEAHSAIIQYSDAPYIARLAAGLPRSYQEAMNEHNAPYWSAAIKIEEDALRLNKTFEIVERTPEMHVIPFLYVFRVKKDVGPKVRICAKGFAQLLGLEYGDTFSSVVCFTVVRCFFAIVCFFDLECDQMDVVTAFLNGDLDKVIYMELPFGFRDPNRPHLVARLLKSLYGLKQAPRCWHAKIHKFLTEKLGFVSCPYEPCFYILHSGP